MEIKYQRPWLYDKQQRAIFNDARISVVEASTKSGKALHVDELVYTPNGPVPIGSLVVGNEVFAADGTSTNVVGVYPQGKQDIYDVKFTCGTHVFCTKDHLWEISGYDIDTQILNTSELEKREDKHRLWVPYCQPVQYKEQPVPIDPYILGLLLGDGGFTADSLRFSSADLELLKAVGDTLEGSFAIKHSSDYDYLIQDNRPVLVNGSQNNKLILSLRLLGLWGLYSDEKFIPNIYKYNSINVRQSVLQGLLDSDGWVNRQGQIRFEQTSSRLAEDVQELVFSFGGFSRISIKTSDKYKTVYRMNIQLDDPKDFLRLKRKKDAARPKRKRKIRRKIKSINYYGRAEAVCIEVDHPRQLFLTTGYIPTHNTVGCIAWLFEKALLEGGPNKNFWWIAPVSGQSEIAWRRMKHAVPVELYEKNENLMRMTLLNGSMISFKSGDEPDSLYGEDVYAAVIDEASRVKEESWHAIRSTLTATRGQIRIIGNVKGKKNWAWKLARKAEQGAKNIEYHKIDVYDAIEAGIIEKEEVENAKAVLPDNVFRELYLAEAADDGGNPFGLEHIEVCIQRDERGNYLNKPMKGGNPIVWGWDVAKSINWTVGIALDLDGNVVDFRRWKDSWEATFRRVIKFTDGLPALVDSTGSGDQFLERLKREGGYNFEGYKFTGRSKQDLMIGLAVAIQQREITYPNGHIVDELEMFEYEHKPSFTVYAAADGHHDDCVDALALAVKHWKSTSRFEPGIIPMGFEEPSYWRRLT